MSKRSDTFSIKLEVMIALAFFNKVEVEILEKEYSYQMENELKNWAESKGIEISIKDIKKPYYVTGHEVYKINENERYKVLSFSKSK